MHGPLARWRRRVALKRLKIAPKTTAYFPPSRSATLDASVSAAENKRYAVPASACHYNGRTDGSATIDHKLPWKFAGMGVINIVRCCQICNSIRAVRPYAWFIPFMGQFLELDADEYRPR